ncbi:hypothetical protein Y032_0020g148 [Ancylostoma ceylanicum]|uniref:Uncharacterized protein n=1 Tax=Ancylostoma ceylanicum TaxID=53326 RepID=A0A016V122_9BILA|nr:hypothetical protein Y032_0020g148 [Ancylostoma ceylanicum]
MISKKKQVSMHTLRYWLCFQGPGKHRGTLKKFSLMLHGTKEPPYAGIEPLLGHVNSKLQVVQTAHKRIAP